MAGSKGLGRGLDVLLKGFSVDKDAMEVTMVKIEDVRPNPRQPRVDFSEQALAELSASIREQGVLQPILVRPSAHGTAHGYELVAGERRLRASTMAGLESIPAIVREVDDELSLALALVENLQRENLNVLEEAKGFEQLIQTFNLSQESLAHKMGRSRSAVANSLRLLQLAPEMQESLRQETMSAGHARALLAVTDDAARRELWARLLESDMSVREAEKQVSFWRDHGVLPPLEETDQPVLRKSIGKPAGDARLKELSSRLSTVLGLRARFGGDASKGKLTIAYATPAELEALLDKLGVDSAC